MKLSKFFDKLPEGIKDCEITDVTNNSRKVTEGTLFVCIKGYTVDGHQFAQSALDNGAAVVVCQRDLGLKNQIIVEDTREFYSRACAVYFSTNSSQLKIIGVTGTNGKTTTSFLLKSMLEMFDKKVGLIGTIHNEIAGEIIPSENTTPDAYDLHKMFRKMSDAGCEYCVMEVSSHALDQKRVSSFEFAATVFTNFTQDHLDYHQTMENYLNAKLKLFKMSKVAIVNADDAVYDKVKAACTGDVITYALNNSNADYIAKGINYKSDGTIFELIGPDCKISRAKTKIPGRFSVYNALCAASTAVALGFEFNEVVEKLSLLKGIKGRAEVVDTGKDFTVIIDYAHTPDGIENILGAMNEIKKGRLVCLFGCGGDRDKSKRPQMAESAARLADYCIITSDNPRTENPESIIEDILEGMKTTRTPYKVIVNREEAIKFAIDNARADDIIVLAGKGHETYQVLGKEKVRFDEREIVKNALN